MVRAAPSHAAGNKISAANVRRKQPKTGNVGAQLVKKKNQPLGQQWGSLNRAITPFSNVTKIRPWHLPWVLSTFHLLGCKMVWQTDSAETNASDSTHSDCAGTCAPAAPVPFSRVVIMQFGSPKTLQECPDDDHSQGFSGCLPCPETSASQPTHGRTSSSHNPSPLRTTQAVAASECIAPPLADNGCAAGEVCVHTPEDGFSACLFALGTLPTSACPADYPDHVLTISTNRNADGAPECRCDTIGELSTSADTFVVTFCCQPAVQPPK